MNYWSIIKRFAGERNNLVVRLRIRLRVQRNHPSFGGQWIVIGSRFVVQEHTTPDGVHWDLMLETEQTLTTFRLAKRPEDVLRHAVEAV